MIRRRFLAGLAAATVAFEVRGNARADGTSLLDIESPESERQEVRDWLKASAKRIAVGDLPGRVRSKALAAVPGLKLEEALRLQHRPITGFRSRVQYSVRGRDGLGNLVWIRTEADGSDPVVTRQLPVSQLPEAALREGRTFAAKQGYTLTSALVVTRASRSLLRSEPRVDYYLRGVSAARPDKETYVWLEGSRGFGLKDLDDLMLKQMELELK